MPELPECKGEMPFRFRREIDGLFCAYVHITAKSSFKMLNIEKDRLEFEKGIHDNRKRREKLEFERQNLFKDRKYEPQNRELELLETRMVIDCDKP